MRLIGSLFQFQKRQTVMQSTSYESGSTSNKQQRINQKQDSLHKPFTILHDDTLSVRFKHFRAVLYILSKAFTLPVFTLASKTSQTLTSSKTPALPMRIPRIGTLQMQSRITPPLWRTVWEINNPILNRQRQCRGCEFILADMASETGYGCTKFGFPTLTTGPRFGLQPPLVDAISPGYRKEPILRLRLISWSDGCRGTGFVRSIHAGLGEGETPPSRMHAVSPTSLIHAASNDKIG